MVHAERANFDDANYNLIFFESNTTAEEVGIKLWGPVFSRYFRSRRVLRWGELLYATVHTSRYYARVWFVENSAKLATYRENVTSDGLEIFFQIFIVFSSIFPPVAACIMAEDVVAGQQRRQWRRMPCDACVDFVDRTTRHRPWKENFEFALFVTAYCNLNAIFAPYNSVRLRGRNFFASEGAVTPCARKRNCLLVS